MNTLPIIRISLVITLVFASAVTAPAQTTTAKELLMKEAQLEKKEADLERQRLELEAAKKQLRLEETAQRVTMRLEGDVLFDSGKSQLRPEAQSALEKLAIVLGQFPTAAVTIEGHTDSAGKPAGNLALSEKRALAVQEFLKKRAELAGIHFTTRGLGETRPIAANDTDAGRLQNRRVEVVIEKAK